MRFREAIFSIAVHQFPLAKTKPGVRHFTPMMHTGWDSEEKASESTDLFAESGITVKYPQGMGRSSGGCRIVNKKIGIFEILSRAEG